MIWIYHADNTDYDHNGDCALMPESCEADSVLNGSWELTLIHPIDPEGRYKEIAEGAVLSVPTQQGDRQRYRIYHRGKNDTEVTAYARPVFFDSADEVFLMDKRPTEKTGQEALDVLLEGTGYTGFCDIAKKETAYYVRKNLMEALQGQEDQSFLSRWGGEILYDNKKISILDHAGSFKGARAEFGYNLEAIKESVNMENVITRIVPVAYNGYTLPGGAPWIDSPNIGKYPVIHIRTVEYPEIKMTEDAGEDEEGFETKEELWEALRKAAKADFETGCDLPEVTYQVDLIDLSQTEEYKNYKDLEKVNLGDSVYCHHAPLDIEVMARVISIKWDCILNRAAEITLGNYRTSYFDQIAATYSRAKDLIDCNGNLVAERMAGVINAEQVQIKQRFGRMDPYAKPAILFEILDPDDPEYGAMAFGAQGWMTAKHKKSSGDWDWQAMATVNGVSADLIKTGTMLADRIRGGTLNFGGINNKNGKMVLVDAKNQKIGELDATGAKLLGTFSTREDDTGCKAKMENGSFEIVDDVLKVMQFLTKVANHPEGKKYMPQICLNESSENLTIEFENGATYCLGRHGVEEETGTVSGRAEFSDGTYIDVKCGRIVGGKTLEGSF